MDKIKKAVKLIQINWRTLAGFELLYKILSMAVFTPFFWGIFNFVMYITGYEYLTIENIIPFLLNPVTAAALFILFLCMAVYTMIDISAVIFILDQSFQGKKTGIIYAIKYAVKNAAKVFHRKNIFVAFIVLFLIPFLNIGVASSYVSSISIPEFIMEFIIGNKYLSVAFICVLLLLSALLLKWLYAFHYFTLEGCDFKEARRKSAKLSIGNRIKDLLVLSGVQFFFYIIYFIMVLAGILFAVFLSSFFSKLKLAMIISASVVWVFLLVSFLIAFALGTPVSYACISILFYGHKQKIQEETIHIKQPLYKVDNKRLRALRPMSLS